MKVLVAGEHAPRLVDVATPEPGPGQLRVRVVAAAVNPVDVFTQRGGFAELVGERSRTGLGWDVAGVVDALGDGVNGMATGDAVYGFADRLAVSAGTHAERVVLDADAVAAVPDLDPVRVAALPLNASTAWQGLDALDLAPAATLLVTGAAGAVGGYAVRLAARRGLRVVAAVRPGARDAVPAGVEHVVETGDDWPDRVRTLVPGGVVAAFDAAGLGGAALNAIRGGGRYLSVLPVLALPVALRGITTRAVAAYADRTVLAGLAKLAAAGELELPEVETFGLDQASEAYERAVAPGRRTRVVLVP